MTVAEPASGTRDTGGREVNVSISIQTILVVAGAVAIAWALTSIANVLLVVFVSFFSVAVLSPIASAMERHLGWSRGWCSTVLVLAIVLVIGVVALILVQAISGSVRGFSDDLPQIVDKAKHSNLGSFINRGSDSLETLRKHASEIANGVGKVSGGVAHVGASAFGAVALAFSVVFLTLFGLVDEPRWRDWIGSLLYRDKRERYLRVTDRIIQTTSRYMLGNLAISVICGTVYGVTALLLDLPYRLRWRSSRSASKP
jgi:predicted PurR-regulated permease PerM